MKAILAALLVAAGLTGAHAQDVKFSISTGGTGGVWYPMGGAMANVLTKYYPGGAAVTAEVTGGSVDNLKLLGAKRSGIGFSMVDAAWDAYNGKGKFKQKTPLRTIAVVHPLVMHVVTAEDRGINSIRDFKGKRISTGSPGSGTEVMALRILEAYGIDPSKDVERERLGVSEAANALKDRKIDAFMHAAGVPLPAVVDVSVTPGIRMKLIDHGDALKAMTKKYGPIYAAGKIPAGSYSGQKKDNLTVNVWGVLLVHESASDKMVYNVLKTLFDHHKDLVLAHRESANMTFANQQIGATAIPWHKAALKYFSDQGVKAR